jgi:probable F420-dependent oxidoreductase
VEVGIFIFLTDYCIAVDELAVALEERGFESMFQPEHTHIPVSRESPFPGGGDLPREYSHTYDPFVSLSIAAAVTKKLKVGTGICLIPQREPIQTANSVASLDRLSSGRFLFGIGGGWNKEEMNNHGAHYKTRFKLLRERVLAMQQIWREEEASFHGEFVNFDPIWSHPKPIQKPYPPILLGGETDYTLARVAEFCDGWIPRGSSFQPARDMARLRKAADVVGRNADELSVTVFRAPPEKAALAQYAEHGVERALLGVPPLPRDEVLALLDDYAKLLD